MICLGSSSFILFIGCNKKDPNNIPKKYQQISTNYGNDSDIITINEAKLIAERITEDILTGNTIEITVRNIETSYEILGENNIPSAYVFNYENGNGFSIISADYRYEPILSYVSNGSLNEGDSVVPMMGEWLAANTEQIENIRTNNIRDTTFYPFYRARWNETINDLNINHEHFIHPIRFEQPGYDPCNNWTTYTKTPLMQTTWGQDEGYNDSLDNYYCSNSINGRPPTGCVATAMAQIIRYWEPSNSFNFNYNSMPNNYGNGEVQRLMKIAGEKVDMDYNCNGSGAYSSKVKNALKNHFGIAHVGNLTSYDNSSSKWDIFNDINLNRPVYLSASTGYEWKGFIIKWKYYTGGHAWVADGYIQNTDGCNSSLKFNMNWGWNGYQNGWYYENSWNPSPEDNYQYNRDYYKNIYN
ncbi:MAG TPA: C10 family peptidase [Edaphocola sp.]|nr:C10 family peptidase [Edaphocola sp.]